MYTYTYTHTRIHIHNTIYVQAREVCEKSVQLMQRLEKKISEMASSTEVQDAVQKTLTEKLKDKDAAAVAYAIGVCSALAARRSFMSKDWAKACAFAGDESAGGAALEAARSLSVVEEEEEDDDDAEQLCDCTFTLAYGTDSA